MMINGKDHYCNALEFVEYYVLHPDYNKKTLKEKLEFLDEIQETLVKLKLKTKAQQLGITEFPYMELDEKKRIIYYEQKDGYWYKKEWHKCGYDSLVLFNTGLYIKYDFNDKGKQIYCETFAYPIYDSRNEKPKKRGRPKELKTKAIVSKKISKTEFAKEKKRRY